jgi:tetratricopeptide (TPR) repeat protein
MPRTFAEVSVTRAVFGAAALAVALLAAWSQWQPQRSEDAREQAVLAASAHPQAALADARRAVSIDPLSPLALLTLADVERLAGEGAAARATLEKAVREQPSNPQTWLALGRFDLAAHAGAQAMHELQAAIYLDPQSIAPELLSGPHREEEAVRIYNAYIEALRLGGASR